MYMYVTVLFIASKHEGNVDAFFCHYAGDGLSHHICQQLYLHSIQTISGTADMNWVHYVLLTQHINLVYVILCTRWRGGVEFTTIQLRLKTF